MKRVFLLLLLACCLLTAPAAAAGGSGTAADPYIVETAAELQSMQNNLAAYYKLANDINLQGVSITPIGDISSPFIGSFDGAGYTISNLVISSSTQSTGFFSCLGSGATIRDVTFQDCSVTTTSSWCGAVIGSILMSSSTHETARVSNVDCVRCSVSSVAYASGCLVGQIGSSAVVDITDCDVSYSDAQCDGSYVSCLAGAISGESSVEITRCNVLYSHARAAGQIVGCFVGDCVASTSVVIESSVARNSIAEAVGGDAAGCLVGWCNSMASVTILNSDVVDCIAKAKNYVGGLYGLNWGGSFAASDCTITGCTIVATNGYAGGVAGCCLSGTTGIFSRCTVTDSTIIAPGYAAGVCPAYS